MNRCGKCANCQDLEQVRLRVLACVNPPFSSATGAGGTIDYGIVGVWNTELERLPCTETDGHDPGAPR